MELNPLSDNYADELQKRSVETPEERASREQFFEKLAPAKAASLEQAIADHKVMASEPIQTADSINVQDLSRNQLIRLVKDLQDQLNRADLMSMVSRAQELRASRAPQFQHREAFMLMTYVSEGGTDVKLVWNSRDGVTPFTMVIDGLKYTHDIPKMRGPFFDRPEGIIGQWETRTEAKMMEAWHRTLQRAVLTGRMPQEKANAYANNPDVARSWNLSIGLRSMASGKFTDEQ